MISKDSLTVVNKGIIGAAGGGAAIAVLAVIMFGTGLFPGPGQPSQTGEQGGTAMKEVTLTLTGVDVKEIDEESATIEPTFEVFNPNRNTMVLEEIQYTLMANGVTLAHSTIGERLQGMVSGTGHTYYVVSNIPLSLKGTVQIKNTKSLTPIWGNLQDNDVDWRVTGNYVLTDPVRMGGQEKPFDFTK